MRKKTGPKLHSRSKLMLQLGERNRDHPWSHKKRHVILEKINQTKTMIKTVEYIVLSTQSLSTSSEPMDCIPSDSLVQRILQARILEWIAIPFSRGSC